MKKTGGRSRTVRIVSCAIIAGWLAVFSACASAGITGSVFSLEFYYEQAKDYSEEELPGIPQDTTETDRNGSTTAERGGKPASTSATRKASSGNKYKIVVYNGSQSTVVYRLDENGSVSGTERVFRCSTGADSSPTRTGKYKIRAKYRWRWLVGGVYGQYCSSISPSYLFHSVPYYRMDPSTLKDAEYDKLGSPASKGCIRMCVTDCKWIYDNMPIGTVVSIVNENGPSAPDIPARNRDALYRGWDPTDQWAAGNPYFHHDPSTDSTTDSTSSTESRVSSAPDAGTSATSVTSSSALSGTSSTGTTLASGPSGE